MNEGLDSEVFLVPVGEDSVLVFPTSSLDEDNLNGVAGSALFDALGPLVGAVLGRIGVNDARMFKMSPESERMLRDARLDEVGGYFRGVLRNPDGKISHQVQLREVHAAPPPSGFDAVAAAQMAAIQAQLSRIEDTLSDLATSVDKILDFLEVQQRAKVQTSLRLLREMHDRAQQTREITATDWQRLTGVEFELESQLHAIMEELKQRLSGRNFGKNPKSDAQEMKKIEPQRVVDLFKTYRMLLGGLRGWYELLVLRKYEAGELTDAEVTSIKDRLRQLEDRYQEYLTLLDAVIKASKKTKNRGWLGRLLTDGLVLGSQHDSRDIAVVESGRDELARLRKSAARALASPNQRIMLTAPSDNIGTDTA